MVTEQQDDVNLAGARRTERLRRWFDATNRAMSERIGPAIRDGKPALAVRHALDETAASAIVAAERADKLEARIAALEAAAKPRRR